MARRTDIDVIAEDIRTWRQNQGFLTPDSLDTEAARDAMLGKLMLVVTEVAEAAEAVRKMDVNNFEEELADILIRVLDIMDTCHITPSFAIAEKMEANQSRQFRHGKYTTL